MRRLLKTGFLATVTFAVSACGGPELDDLQQFVRTTHSQRIPKVEPLPIIEPQRSFAYTASALVDPFSSRNLRPATPSGRDLTGLAPDPGRRREPLESYPLDSLRMVGTLEREDDQWVIIRAPDGSVHHAQSGSYVGQAYGRIMTISEERASVRELIQDPNGRWIEREAALSITQ